MIRKHFALLLPVAIAGFAAQVNASTLEEIYQQALENDHTYKAAQANLAAGQETVKIGRAGLLPAINGSAGYSELDRDTTINNINNSEPDSSSNTRMGFEVGLEQPLFDMNAWYQYKGAKASTDIATTQFSVAEESLIIRTATAYFDALKAVDNLETAKAEENALSHQLEQTRQRFEVGLTAITEVHEAQAVYDSSTAERLIAEGRLGIAFEALEVITGQAQTELSPLKRDLPVAPPVPAEREPWVEMAMENNNALIIQRLTADAAKYNKSALKANHYPTVALQAGYSDYNNDGDLSSDLPADVDTQDQSIGVVLRLPIFNGGGVSASRRQAAQQYIAAREQLNQTQRDIVQLIRSTHLTVTTSVTTVKARAQAIVSNQSALEATQAGYDVGTRDLVDVLNAQRSLYRAQRDYFDALYAYVLSSLELKRAAGTLSANDVAELNQWLDMSRTVNSRP